MDKWGNRALPSLFTSLILFIRYEKPSVVKLLKVPPKDTFSGMTLWASPPFMNVTETTWRWQQRGGHAIIRAKSGYVVNKWKTQDRLQSYKMPTAKHTVSWWDHILQTGGDQFPGQQASEGWRWQRMQQQWDPQHSAALQHVRLFQWSSPKIYLMLLEMALVWRKRCLQEVLDQHAGRKWPTHHPGYLLLEYDKRLRDLLLLAGRQASQYPRKYTENKRRRKSSWLSVWSSNWANREQGRTSIMSLFLLNEL